MKLSIVAVLALTASADAGTLADAIARHDATAVKALRGQLTDPAARCTLGVVYARRNDLPRAALYLDGCGDAQLPAEISADVARAVSEVHGKLEASQLSKIEIATKPEGMQVEIDALPGETFASPATVWAKAGRYELRGTHDGKVLKTIVTIGAHERTTGYLDARLVPKQTAPRTQHADFSDEGAAEKQQSGPPPDLKHPKLTPDKYQGKVAQLVQENELADPMATTGAAARAHRTDWLGLRLGGGMFDDSAAGARAGLAVAVTVRHALGAPFLALRLDYSRRGGGDPVNALAANAGAGITLAGGGTSDRLALAALAELRGEVRLGDTHGMDGVARAGLGIAAGLELALPSTPFSAGLRFEQGVTPLAGDARDRATLLELGVDLR